MTFKEQVFEALLNSLKEKTDRLAGILCDLRESASNETKSTAGDKHETALAMLQIEQKNTGNQLHNLQLQKSVLDRIDLKARTLRACLGALIKTDRGYFFLAVALGRIEVAGSIVVVLSVQSPLGSKLNGLGVGDTTELNGQTYVVEAII